MMNKVMDQMINAPTSARTATQSAAKSKDSSSDFGSMVRQKQQDSRPTQDNGRPAKTNQASGSDKPAATQSARNGDVPEEQYVIAAAMMMQSWLQMIPFNVTPEENAIDVEITPEFLPDMHVETALDIPVEQIAAETEKTFVEAPRKVFQEVVERVQTELVDFTEHAAEEVQTEEVEETVVVENVEIETPVFGYMNAEPVKVATVQEAPVELEAEDGLEQLRGRIEQFLTDAEGNSYVELTLSPPELGKITVNLTQMADGTLRLQLSASTMRAAEILERNTGGLQQLLASQSRPQVKIESVETEPQPYIFINPNGDNGQDQRRQQGQQKKDRDDRHEHSDRDFIQQLRLGLVSFD